MNEWLAQMYGTNGANNEEQEKLASLDLFAKLAAQNNIDLTQLSDQKVSELYASTFPEQFAKMAQEEEEEEDKEEDKEEDEEEEKKESAARYVQEKLAFQEKFAEADLMGRVMAHSFMQERGELEKAATTPPGGKTTMSETALAKLKKMGDDAPSGVRVKPGMVTKLKGFAKSTPGKAVGAALGTAALAGGGYGAYKGLKGKEKKSSAQQFEELSAQQAVKIASAAGFDSNEAFNRVNAVYILGLQETEKVASVQSVDDAIHVRGLEYLESAGYSVDWSEIFG